MAYQRSTSSSHDEPNERDEAVGHSASLPTFRSAVAVQSPHQAFGNQPGMVGYPKDPSALGYETGHQQPAGRFAGGASGTSGPRGFNYPSSSVPSQQMCGMPPGGLPSMDAGVYGAPGCPPGGMDSYDHDGKRAYSGQPRVKDLPKRFRVEMTNFLAKVDSGKLFSTAIEVLLKALQAALSAAGVDVLEFRPAYCVLECSYQKGNRFMSIIVRVFKAPDRGSGHLIEPEGGSRRDHRENSGSPTGTTNDETRYLIEGQMREGDRLYFAPLFREFVTAFEAQEGVSVGGTYRYHARKPPAFGDGLSLEDIPARREISSGRVGRRGVDGGDQLSRPPPPPSKEAEEDEGWDEDVTADLMTLAKMQTGKMLDVQADAATAVAGLTSDVLFLKRLSEPKAFLAAASLCYAAGVLFLYTSYLPARRQAAVVLGNLANGPQSLRAVLVRVVGASLSAASDYDSAALDPEMTAALPRIRKTCCSAEPLPIEEGYGLLDKLVAYAMGMAEEAVEIGTRRECMRALAGMASAASAEALPGLKDTAQLAAMQTILDNDLTGRWASDPALMSNLEECRKSLRETTAA